MAQQILTLKQIGTSNDILIGEDEIVSYVQKVAPKATGTQDSVVVSELNDSTATFITANVAIGDVVTDTTGFISARVVSVDSETALTLDADIFTASEAYEVGASYDLEYDGDAVAAFLKAGDALVSVADSATNAFVTGDGIYVNANRVISVVSDGSGATINYRSEDVQPRPISTTDSAATVIGAINAIP